MMEAFGTFLMELWRELVITDEWLDSLSFNFLSGMLYNILNLFRLLPSRTFRLSNSYSFTRLNIPLIIL